MPKLNARFVERAKEAGVYQDGECLRLVVNKSGGKYWQLVTAVNGVRRTISLGSALWLNLTDARAEARRLRVIAKNGGDPREHTTRAQTARTSKKNQITFASVVRAYHREHIASRRSAKYVKEWIAPFENHAFPKIGEVPMSSLTTADASKVLGPLYASKYQTARKLAANMQLVFDYAIVTGSFKAINPIPAVVGSIPKNKQETRHHSSMPWQDVPALMAKLKTVDTLASVCLRFLIHTATRSVEARGARWDEIDFEAKVWTIPAERMKSAREHKVPLTPEAVALLKSLEGLDDNFVFPSRGRDPETGELVTQAPSSSFFTKLRKDNVPQDYTTHGFRASFRTWASEVARAPKDVAEAALSHADENKLVQAYQRSDLFDLRRLLNESWSRTIGNPKPTPAGKESASVTRLNAAA